MLVRHAVVSNGLLSYPGVTSPTIAGSLQSVSIHRCGALPVSWRRLRLKVRPLLRTTSGSGTFDRHRAPGPCCRTPPGLLRRLRQSLRPPRHAAFERVRSGAIHSVRSSRDPLDRRSSATRFGSSALAPRSSRKLSTAFKAIAAQGARAALEKDGHDEGSFRSSPFPIRVYESSFRPHARCA